MYYTISLFLVGLLKNIGISIKFNKFDIINIEANIKRARLNIGVGFTRIAKGQPLLFKNLKSIINISLKKYILRVIKGVYLPLKHCPKRFPNY